MTKKFAAYTIKACGCRCNKRKAYSDIAVLMFILFSLILWPEVYAQDRFNPPDYDSLGSPSDGISFSFLIRFLVGVITTWIPIRFIWDKMGTKFDSAADAFGVIGILAILPSAAFCVLFWEWQLFLVIVTGLVIFGKTSYETDETKYRQKDVDLPITSDNEQDFLSDAFITSKDSHTANHVKNSENKLVSQDNSITSQSESNTKHSESKHIRVFCNVCKKVSIVNRQDKKCPKCNKKLFA